MFPDDCLVGAPGESFAAAPPADDARAGTELYHFHRANIHERRFAAFFFRCVPLLTIVSAIVLGVVGVSRQPSILLWSSAVLNVALWLWIVSAAVQAIIGVDKVEEALAAEVKLAARRAQANCQGGDDLPGDADAADTGNGTAAAAAAIPGAVHVVVLPNYREDEAMLEETLHSLREAENALRFRIVLAMEAREGPGAVSKAERLKARFAGVFGDFYATYHPSDIEEEHLDGSVDAEVPGKASNLKWAVAQARARYSADPKIDMDQVVLTVADADCLFHPGYFARVEAEFVIFQRHGLHKWTMWQAPQLPYRNYYTSPAPSRVWGYLSSAYEFGGVSGLSHGGHHMLFSAYSVSLELATNAGLWDGDVIAEDHHAYLKAFFYSAFSSAQAAVDATASGRVASSKAVSSLVACRPALRVRAVMLPVKSTSVESSEGMWQSYIERWSQAKRHAQGVAEVSYSLLACWDMFWTLPLRVYNVTFLCQIFKVLWTPIAMHLMPICQSIALGVFSVYWFLHDRQVPQCPDKIWFFNFNGQILLCGFAGAFALTWPMVIPVVLVMLSNYRFVQSCFLKPAHILRGTSRWHDCDGEVPATLGSKTLTLMALILWDCTVLMGPLMVPYGLFANVVGCFNVMIRGNRFEYVTAAKVLGGAKDKAADYGTLTSSINA